MLSRIGHKWVPWILTSELHRMPRESQCGSTEHTSHTFGSPTRWGLNTKGNSNSLFSSHQILYSLSSNSCLMSWALPLSKATARTGQFGCTYPPLPQYHSTADNRTKPVTLDRQWIPSLHCRQDRGKHVSKELNDLTYIVCAMAVIDLDFTLAVTKQDDFAVRRPLHMC